MGCHRRIAIHNMGSDTTARLRLAPLLKQELQSASSRDKLSGVLIPAHSTGKTTGVVRPDLPVGYKRSPCSSLSGYYGQQGGQQTGAGQSSGQSS
jgi:hypothetical protein